MVGERRISGRNLLQIAAIFGAIFVWAIIIHKAYAVSTMLAQKHSGAEFWMALLRHFLGNLAGG